MRTITINGMSYGIPKLSGSGYSIQARKWTNKIDYNHFIVKTVHRRFDDNLFGFAHTPIAIDPIYNKEKFSKQNSNRILDMPIKFAGSDDYRIPKELHQFDEAIAKIVSYEKSINPHVNEYYAYLTVDQGRVPANTYQRRSGLHVDGFQGARIINKLPINRSYIVYDAIPTKFYAQSFRTDHLDEHTDNFFLSFDEQAEKSAEITFDPYEIVLMNAYTVHAASKASFETDRTFLRVSYDVNRFDRLGNTKNPLFQYEWIMKSRDTQKHLRHRPLPETYGRIL